MYKLKKITWDPKKVGREDGQLVKAAEALGFTIETCYPHSEDSKEMPPDGLKFVIGNVQIWRIVCTKEQVPAWRAADIVSGYYKKHRTYYTLSEALCREYVGWYSG